MKTHRPLSLELDTKTDVAVRIVLPGLPPLSDKMKLTVKLSQKIEQQQRNLIALRNSSGTLSSLIILLAIMNPNTTTGPSSANNSSVNSLFLLLNSTFAGGVPVQVPIHEADDEMDTINTPTTAKRLKRDNIPTPLQIDSPGGNSLRPLIQSAPIRLFRSHPPGGFAPPITGHHPAVVVPSYGGAPGLPVLSQQQQQQQQQQQLLHQHQQQVHHHPHQQQQQQVHPVVATPQGYIYPLISTPGGGLVPPQLATNLYYNVPSWQARRRIAVPPGSATPSGGYPPQYKRLRTVGRPVVSNAQYYIQHQYQQPVRHQVQLQQIPGNAAASPYKKRVAGGPVYKVSSAGVGGGGGGPGTSYPQGGNYYPLLSTPIHSRQPGRSVTDVYHGDYMRTAPLQAQPLSAQYEYFDRANDEDRVPVSEEEIYEMQKKYKDDEEQNDPESAAIGEYDEKHARLASRPQIFGLINLMNESIFNFRIFDNDEEENEEEEKENEEGEEKNPESIEAVQETKELDDEKVKEKEKEKDKDDEDEDERGKAKEVETLEINLNKVVADSVNEKELNEDKENATEEVRREAEEKTKILEKEQSKNEWLVREKAKFMKICETSWNEFVQTHI